MKIQENHKESKYNGFLTPQKNFIWAGAMCLAWQELKQNIIKQPIKLITKNKHALNIIDNFNTSNFLKKDLAEDSYYIASGFGQKTIDKINKEVSAKFKQKTLPKLDFHLGQSDLIAYAYIFKKFDFLNKFQPQQKGTFKFEGKKVNSFYANTIEQKKNVFYFYYENDDDFLIGIKGKNQNDSIFLLKSQNELSVDEVIKNVIHRENKGARRYLTNIDEFQMPMVKIQAQRNIQEIQGLHFANKLFTDKYLAKATQMIKIQINQSGAKFQNQAYIAKKCCKKSQKVEPKRFILNKRFWVVMKEVNKHPYLCMKITSPVEIIKEGKK